MQVLGHQVQPDLITGLCRLSLLVRKDTSLDTQGMIVDVARILTGWARSMCIYLLSMQGYLLDKLSIRGHLASVQGKCGKCVQILINMQGYLIPERQMRCLQNTGEASALVLGRVPHLRRYSLSWPDPDKAIFLHTGQCCYCNIPAQHSAGHLGTAAVTVKFPTMVGTGHLHTQ